MVLITSIVILWSKTAIFRRVWYNCNHTIELLGPIYHTPELSKEKYDYFLAEGTQNFTVVKV